MRKLIFICMYLSLTIPCAADVIYVDNDADGLNDGSSWTDAYNFLQNALDIAVAGDKIYVAKGTYYPDTVGLADPRDASFAMINGVTIEGGYAGFGADDPDDRDIELYETILSGDLLNNDNPATSVQDLLDDPSRADNSYHVFYHPKGTGLDSTAILDGFTITAGNADGSYPRNHGGGMNNYRNRPTVTNCTFRGNSAVRYGGGMFTEYYSPTVTDCKFIGNSAKYGGGMSNNINNLAATNCAFIGNSAYSGGGMYNSGSNTTVSYCTFNGNSVDDDGGGMHNSGCSPTVSHCVFTGNSGSWGGGMYNMVSSPKITNSDFSGNLALTRDGSSGGGIFNEFFSSPTIIDCNFVDNLADGWGGGAMLNYFRSSPTISNCIFTRNSAVSVGGGLCNFDDSNPTVTNCTFNGNSTEDGGGMYNYHDSSPIVTNCTFSGNSAEDGGGMYNYLNSSPMVSNCTFSSNTAEYGGGMFSYYDSSPTITNCILWGNTASSGGNEIYNDDGFPVISYCDIAGSGGGSNENRDIASDTNNGVNIDLDPMFIDADGADDTPGTEDDNLRLAQGSPCIDAGTNSPAGGLLATDLDGNPRIINAVVDIGAYEAIPPSIEATMNFTPTTLNCSSEGNWVKAHFTLPEEFTIEDVDKAKPAAIDSLTITSDHMNVSCNNEELVEIEVAFSRNDFCSIALYGNTELTVRGWFIDETAFYGTDTIRITTNQLEKLPEFSSHWLRTDCMSSDFCEGFDLDHNGIVNLADFVLLAEN